MFFESRGSLIVAGILLLAGFACFLLWQEDTDSARREKTTVGVIDDIGGGRGAIYYFEFEIDGVKLYDEDSSCRTALTPKGCKIGAPVLVYYDRNPALRTKLKEFGAASSDDFAIGSCMVFGAFMVILMHFLARRVIGSDDESDDIDVDRPDEGPETIHVVPGE